MKLTIFKSVQEAYVADVVEGDWAEIAGTLMQHDPSERKHEVLMYNFAEFKTLADPTAESARRYHGEVVDGQFVRDPSGTFDLIPNTIRRCKANVVALWGIVLDVDENKTIEEAIELCKQSSIVNMVGKCIVTQAVKEKLVHPEAIIKIKGIPHAQIIKM